MENEKQEPFAIVERSAVQLMERANIDAQIATAQQYPKHQPNMLAAVKANMLSFATLDEETAASCFYTLPRGNKVIQGASIRMAEIGISCYGNVRVSVRVVDVVDNTPHPHVVVQAVCHDLENNIAVSIEKRRRITKKKKNEHIDEDDINLAVNACTAIGFRDAAFKVIPLALVKPAWQAAKFLAVGDVESLPTKREMVIEHLKKMGAREERILEIVGCRTTEDISLEHLAVLIGLGTALKDGEITLEDAFPENAIKRSGPSGVTGLRDRLTQRNGRNEPEDTTTENTPPPTEEKKSALRIFACTHPNCKKEYKLDPKTNPETACECGQGTLIFKTEKAKRAKDDKAKEAEDTAAAKRQAEADRLKKEKEAEDTAKEKFGKDDEIIRQFECGKCESVFRKTQAQLEEDPFTTNASGELLCRSCLTFNLKLV